MLQVDGLHLFSKSLGTSKELINIATVASLSEAKLDQNVNWTEEYLNLLTEDEREIVKSMDDLLTTELVGYIRFAGGSSIVDLSPKEREEKLFERLEELMKKQTNMVNSLRKRLK